MSKLTKKQKIVSGIVLALLVVGLAVYLYPREKYIYVDAAWASLPPGTIVELPNGKKGELGVDAFSSIQAGLDADAIANNLK